MGHVSNRLYSTASKLAVSTAHLSHFPPREAVVSQAFDPHSWAALQPPPPSALTAFSHRIGLGAIIASPDTVRRACTHKSFLNLHAKYYPSSPAPPTNADLVALGNSLMGLFASEYLHVSYPHLPTRVLKAAVSAHVGPLTCASVAQEMGATPLLRWHRQVRPSTVSRFGLAHCFSAVHTCVASTLAFRRARVNTACADRIGVPREIAFDSSQIRPLLFPHPPGRLAHHVKIPRSKTRSYGDSRKIWSRTTKVEVGPCPRPCVFRLLSPLRLLKETGRFSNSPIFVVGIYSGADKLGEGFGSSLKMAEYRVRDQPVRLDTDCRHTAQAAEDSLHRLYLTRTPSDLLQLPSSTFDPQGNIYKPGPVADYTPGVLGEAEVLYASSGRSGIIAPKRPSIEELASRKAGV